MIFDWTVSIPLLITVFTISLGILWRFFASAAKINQTEKIADEAMKKTLETKEQLADLKLELARSYPTHSSLRDLEERLSKSIDGLANEVRSLRNYIMDKKE
jgi:spore coat protein CotH